MSQQFVKTSEFNSWKRKIEDRLDGMQKTKKTAAKRAPTEYQLFVKKKLVSIKRGDPGISQSDAFKKAAQMWAARKQ